MEIFNTYEISHHFILVENPCFVNPCQNGGKCVEVAGGYTCSCRTGWRCNDCSCKGEEITRQGVLCTSDFKYF